MAGSTSRRRCGPPQRRDCSAVRRQQVGVVGAVHLQHRHRRRAGDGSGEPAALGAHLRPDGPAVVLERGVRGARHLDRPPVALDGDGEVVGAHPVGAGPPAHEVLDVHTFVGPQPPLGPPGNLRTEHAAPAAEQGAALSARVTHDAAPHGQRVRCAQDRQAGDQARVQRGDRPADHAAPAVPDDPGRGLAERADQPGDVARERPEVVAARGLVRVAVAAQVHRDGPEPRLGQRRQLAAPGPPELREAVQQHHQRRTRVARLRDVQADAVRGDVTVLPRSGQPDRRRVGNRPSEPTPPPPQHRPGVLSARRRAAGAIELGTPVGTAQVLQHVGGLAEALDRPLRLADLAEPSGSRGTRTARHREPSGRRRSRTPPTAGTRGRAARPGRKRRRRG